MILVHFLQVRLLRRQILPRLIKGPVPVYENSDVELDVITENYNNRETKRIDETGVDLKARILPSPSRIGFMGRRYPRQC